MNNQEAIETLKANYPDACYEQLRKAVDMAISTLQAQDVPAQPEIIRCEYCRYWEEIMTGKGHCKDMYGFGRWWKDSDFCSNAKRKEDGSDEQSAYRKYFEDLGKNNPEQAKKEATNELIKMGLLNSDGSTKETIVSI